MDQGRGLGQWRCRICCCSSLGAFDTIMLVSWAFLQGYITIIAWPAYGYS
jgi:hypothetical protein